MRTIRPFIAGLLLTGPTLAAAQAPAPDPAPPAETATDGEGDDPEIIVQGQRERGAVLGDIPPEVRLGPADIRSYGVSSVSDLLAELAPQTRSDRGRGGEGPVVLLNGRRISSFAEIRDLPTEAIQRVDILPEEVALKYGYGANQRVVNFVLRRRFRAITTELEGGAATEGGGANGEGELGALRIQGDGRVNLDLKYQRSAALRESDRDLISTASGGPYDLAGNITAGGGEIDPRLSALAGQPVTIAGVPAGAAAGAPAIADFVAGANRANATDVARYRTLRPATEQFTANAVLARPLSATINATINATLDLSSSDARRGLPGANLTLPAGDPFSPFATDVILSRYLASDPLRQRTTSGSGHIGFGLNGDAGGWRLNLTGNYDHGESRTTTQTGFDTASLRARLAARDAALNPFAPLDGVIGAALTDRARSLSDTGNVQLVASGTIAQLPAGPLATSVKIGGEAIGLDARSTRAGITQTGDLSRRSGNAQINLDLPIASRRSGVLAAIGNLSANVNLAVDQLSDFGTLRTFGYGFNWSPITQVTLIGSVSDEDGAPSIQQLGNPAVLTPDVRVFDYTRGLTVDVLQISGGNPALAADDRHVVKLGLTLKPLTKTDLTLSANYVSSRTANAIATLPEPTADIEAAFPERFVRDASGRLTSVDSRPVNFARERREELRWGVNFSLALRSRAQKMFEAARARRQAAGEPEPDRPAGTGRPSGQAGQTGDGARPGGLLGAFTGGGGGFGGRPGGGDRGGGGGFRGGGGGPGGAANAGGRLQFALYHTWHFRDDILIRDGVPVLDLLDGASVGAGGGQPRHEIEAQAGLTNNGIGARISANWQSGTRVRDGIGGSTGDLTFSTLTTANLRLFANLGQIPSLARTPWARGARVTLSVTNLFDDRLRVRDAGGATPLRYQPAYLDALGRTIRISVRKLF